MRRKKKLISSKQTKGERRKKKKLNRLLTRSTYSQSEYLSIRYASYKMSNWCLRSLLLVLLLLLLLLSMPLLVLLNKRGLIKPSGIMTHTHTHTRTHTVYISTGTERIVLCEFHVHMLYACEKNSKQNSYTIKSSRTVSTHTPYLFLLLIHI